MLGDVASTTRATTLSYNIALDIALNIALDLIPEVWAYLPGRASTR